MAQDIPRPHRLNILLVSSLFPNVKDPSRGIFTAQLASELHKVGNVTVISPLPWAPRWGILNKYQKWSKFSDVPCSSEINGIKVYYPRYFLIPKISGPLHSFLVFMAIFGLIRRLSRLLKIDVINAHWIYPDGIASLWSAKILSLPIMVTGLGSDINLFPEKYLKRIQIAFCLKAAHRVSAVSAALKQKMVRLGVPENKIVVIPSGIDFNRFSPAERDVCRQKLGLTIEAQEKTVLFVGHLVKVKGVEYLLHAIALMKEKASFPCRVFLIGEGDLRSDLERLVRRLNLTDCVFFQGPKRHHEIPIWIGASDLLVLPSLQEGLPNVVLEALACGRPVVASNVGGIPEVVSEARDNGMVCPPGNPQILSEALLKVLQKAYLPESIQSAIRHLTWGFVAERYYRELSVIAGVSHRSCEEGVIPKG